VLKLVGAGTIEVEQALLRRRLRLGLRRRFLRRRCLRLGPHCGAAEHAGGERERHEQSDQSIHESVPPRRSDGDQYLGVHSTPRWQRTYADANDLHDCCAEVTGYVTECPTVTQPARERCGKSPESLLASVDRHWHPPCTLLERRFGEIVDKGGRN